MSSDSFIPIKKINTQKLSVYRDSSSVLKVKIESEKEDSSFRPIRCFPLTDSEHYLGLFKVDSEGTTRSEIALIDDFNRLDENSKKLIEEELDKECPLTWIKKIY